MYADSITGSMQRAIDETDRRRSIQEEYNREHGITPKTVQKGIRDKIEATVAAEETDIFYAGNIEELTEKERKDIVSGLEKEMRECAQNLQFERAAQLRDRILEIKAYNKR